MTSAAEIVNFRGETVDPRIDAFIRRVGERVAEARRRKGITRRALSDFSGVSQRYLAQLEAGEGNVSIAVLHRVADALDHRVEWLVGEDDPWTSPPAEAARLFALADGDRRRRVLDILRAKASETARAQRICLIGLRGAGKSTLGRLLGEKLDVTFLELNRDIEEQAGMPVAEVMALYGQEGYRRLERQALERVVASADQIVLAAAGGVVAEPETFAFLCAHFHTVWLKASPEEHMNRVLAQGDRRPMAGNPRAIDELKAILTSREALYGRAESVVETDGRTIEAGLRDLVAAAAAFGITREHRR